MSQETNMSFGSWGEMAGQNMAPPPPGPTGSAFTGVNGMATPAEDGTSSISSGTHPSPNHMSGYLHGNMKKALSEVTFSLLVRLTWCCRRERCHHRGEDAKPDIGTD